MNTEEMTHQRDKDCGDNNKQLVKTVKINMNPDSELMLFVSEQEL